MSAGYSIFRDTIADLTWPVVEAAAKADQPLLLPVAVIEQHGLHLPLATDVYGAHVLSSLVKQELVAQGVMPISLSSTYNNAPGGLLRTVIRRSTQPPAAAMQTNNPISNVSLR